METPFPYDAPPGVAYPNWAPVIRASTQGTHALYCLPEIRCPLLERSTLEPGDEIVAILPSGVYATYTVKRVVDGYVEVREPLTHDYGPGTKVARTAAFTKSSVQLIIDGQEAADKLVVIDNAARSTARSQRLAPAHADVATSLEVQEADHVAGTPETN